MTKDFDPLNEFPLHSEEFGEGMHHFIIFIEHLEGFSMKN